MTIHPDQIAAAESVLRQYIQDPKVSVFGAFMEAYNAFHDAAPQKTPRTRKSTGLTKIPDECPDLHSRDLAKTYWGRVGRHDLVARLDDVVEGFRNHHIACGTTMESWPAAWVTWYRNAVKFEKTNAQLTLVGVTPEGYEETSESGWLYRLETFMGHHSHEKGYWRAQWGPRPKEPGCKLPESVRQKYLTIYPPRSSQTS